MRALVLLLGLTASGCRSEPTPPARALATASATSSSSSPSRSASSAILELGRLDARAPVPLLPMMAEHQKQNMRDHLVRVQEIVAAAGIRDFQAIENAARKIGYSEPMERMCSHMGAAAPGFTERALAFHHTADTIGNAAREHDVAAVLRALSATLSSCADCHATFKQEVVAVLPEGSKGAPPAMRHE